MKHACREEGVSRETDRPTTVAIRPRHPPLPGGGRRPGCCRGSAGHRSGHAHRGSGGRCLPARDAGHRTPHSSAALGGGRAGAGPGLLAHRAGRSPRECGGEVGVAGTAAGAGNRAGARLAERAAHRLAGRPRHPGGRGARRLLLALFAAAGPCRRRACRGARADRHRGLGVCGDHRRHAATDPGLHGAHRLGDPLADGPSVAAPVTAVGAFPGRRRRAAHAEGVRPGQGAGRVDQADHRRVPAGDHADAADRLPVVLRAGAAGDDLGRTGRGHHRHAARARRDGPVHRAGHPCAGPRGISAGPAGGRPVPRGRRGTRGGRGDLRGPGDTGADARGRGCAVRR